MQLTPSPRGFRQHLGLLLACGIAAMLLNATAVTPASAELAPGLSRFVPLPPARVLDTRIGLGAVRGPVGPNSAIELTVVGQAGVPAGATAIMLNLTATGSTSTGYVQVYASGDRPTGPSSNLNLDSAGQTIANQVVSPIGTNGKIELFTWGGTHLIADVLGYFNASGPTAAGRFVALDPMRVVDTRLASTGKVAAGGTLRVPLAGVASLPTAGWSAAVVNVTATETSAAGFFQVVPTGGSTPLGETSNINVDGPQRTAANLVTVPRSSDGSITIYSERGAHVIVDVLGYFTDATAAVSRNGLFLPVTPKRVLDTRSGDGAPPGKLAARASVTVGVGATVASGAALLGLTATQTNAPGYFSLAPTPVFGERPFSNLNASRADQTITNSAMVKISPTATVSIYSEAGAHVVLDVTGYFVGDTEAALPSIASFGASADASVNEATPTTNEGLLSELVVDGSPRRQTFIRFDVSGVDAPIASARLVLRTADIDVAASPSGGVLTMSWSNAWSETGVVWSTRPPLNGPRTTTIPAVARNSEVVVDVSPYVVGNGAITFAVSSANDDGAYFSSRETPFGPRLDVFYGPLLQPPSRTNTLYAVGDIASCAWSADEANANMLAATSGAIATLGDTAYPSGTAAEFADCFTPAWGKLTRRIRPAVGNHEYLTPGAVPYYDVFGASAGDPTKGYYSYDLGQWHIVVLNSNCGEVGGCGVGSPQEMWLRADLAANAAPCTLAYWHHPRFSSSAGHGSDATYQPFWQALYDANADIVLSGHDHDYERFAPQTPAGVADAARGIRQFVVGTGGATPYPFVASPPATSEARTFTSFGVLKLTLNANSYSWEFVQTAGLPFADAGSTTCH